MHQEIAETTEDFSAGDAAPCQSVEDARAQALALAWPVAQTEPVPLLSAVGRVLAEPFQASQSLPHFDNAAMDGYPVWAGGGTTGVALVGVLALKEQASGLKGLGVLLVVAGIVALNAS